MRCCWLCTGRILTIETLPLKLARKLWAGPDHLNPDQTYFPDEYLHHVLYITRIYFIYGITHSELIGLLLRRCCFLFFFSIFLFLGKIALAQPILPIATHFSVARSICLYTFVVCRLSHSCTLLKPFDEFACRLTDTFAG